MADRWGGARVTFSATTNAYVQEMMQREVQHLTLLRTQLGASAATVPVVDLTPRGGFLQYAEERWGVKVTGYNTTGSQELACTGNSCEVN